MIVKRKLLLFILQEFMRQNLGITIIQNGENDEIIYSLKVGLLLFIYLTKVSSIFDK